MGRHSDTDESHSLRGPIDRLALLTVRDIFAAEEPLADTGGYKFVKISGTTACQIISKCYSHQYEAQLDDYLDPSVLEIAFEDGLCEADTARIDVQWTTRDDYKFHYTDSKGVNFRWGNHPHDSDYVRVSGLEHYHPPPNATSDPTDVEESCIEQSLTKLVARAVHNRWRAAYHADSLSPLNAGHNPP